MTTARQAFKDFERAWSAVRSANRESLVLRAGTVALAGAATTSAEQWSVSPLA